MKYIFFALVFCFLCACALAIVIRHYEVMRMENKAFVSKNEALEQQVIDCNREVNQVWKEKNFWIREAKRKK